MLTWEGFSSCARAAVADRAKVTTTPTTVNNAVFELFNRFIVFPPVSPCANAKAVPIRNRLNSLSTRRSQYVISRTHSRNREVFASCDRGAAFGRTARLGELFRLRPDKQQQYEKTC